MAAASLGVVGLVELMADTMTTACVLLDCLPDREPHVLYVNPAFTRMTGYTREELQGVEMQTLSSEVTEAAVMHRIRLAMRNGHPIHGVKTNARKTGETYKCELTLRPLRDESGHVSHYISFVREVRRRRGRPPLTGQRFEPVAAGDQDEDRFFLLD